jgi:hypothetical protein
LLRNPSNPLRAHGLVTILLRKIVTSQDAWASGDFAGQNRAAWFLRVGIASGNSHGLFPEPPCGCLPGENLC